MSADRIQELRQQGLALYMSGQAEEALPYFTEALGLGPDDETRDLLIVNTASAQLALKQSSPEIQELPQIMMRRPNLRGLAAYHLSTKFENEREFKRARVYLEIALKSAEQEHDERLRIVTLIDLGNLCVYDSETDAAMGWYKSALELINDRAEFTLWRAFATGNLGYCHLMKEDPATGAVLIHQAIGLYEASGGESYTAEGLIDLCLAYLDLNDLDKARDFGQRGLSRASEPRQVRNAHYLLGEIAYKKGEIETAKEHFGILSTYYPEFPQLTNLLFALDLRKMVNFRL